MNMGKILLNEVLSHADKLKEEIKKRLKCEIVDFEIVEYESGEIGVHWNATYKSEASYVDIPYKWIRNNHHPIPNKTSCEVLQSLPGNH